MSGFTQWQMKQYVEKLKLQQKQEKLKEQERKTQERMEQQLRQFQERQQKMEMKKREQEVKKKEKDQKMKEKAQLEEARMQFKEKQMQLKQQMQQLKDEEMRAADKFKQQQQQQWIIQNIGDLQGVQNELKFTSSDLEDFDDCDDDVGSSTEVLATNIEVNDSVNYKFNSKLVDDYETLRKNGKFSDAILKVQGKVFQVHKAILAVRSSVFGNIFETEKNKSLFELDDISAEVCEVLLQFIYTGKVDPEYLGRNESELSTAADKYILADLKEECERYSANGQNKVTKPWWEIKEEEEDDDVQFIQSLKVKN